MNIDEAISIAKNQAVADNGDWVSYLSHIDSHTYYRIVFSVSNPGSVPSSVAYDVDKKTKQCSTRKWVG